MHVVPLHYHPFPYPFLPQATCLGGVADQVEIYMTLAATKAAFLIGPNVGMRTRWCGRIPVLRVLQQTS